MLAAFVCLVPLGEMLPDKVNHALLLFLAFTGYFERLSEGKMNGPVRVNRAEVLDLFAGRPGPGQQRDRNHKGIGFFRQFDADAVKLLSVEFHRAGVLGEDDQ